MSTPGFDRRISAKLVDWPAMCELEILRKLSPNAFEITVKRESEIVSQESGIRAVANSDLPERENVLSEMKDHQIVHFSCQGQSNLTDPSLSMLLLHDWRTTPLTVSDLWSLKLESADFAFLSACRTADVKDLKLLDESIHLCSAVQLAGCSSVIGSLWEVLDNETADLVEEVYTWMLNGGQRLQTHRAAEALHRAVLNLRERANNIGHFQRKAESAPLTWASYIYLGI